MPADQTSSEAEAEQARGETASAGEGRDQGESAPFAKQAPSALPAAAPASSFESNNQTVTAPVMQPGTAPGAATPLVRQADSLTPVGSESRAGLATTASAGAPPRRSVLRHVHFRRVWLAAFVSNVGNWMELVGMQLVVAKLTGELKMAAYLGAAQMLPILFLGVFGGLMADRVDRRRLLFVTQLMLMGVAACVAGASAIPWENPRTLAWVFVGLGAVNACVMAFNSPAWQVLTPRLVPRDELIKAITLNGIQFNLARVVGPALGGLVMAWSTAWLLSRGVDAGGAPGAGVAGSAGSVANGAATTASEGSTLARAATPLFILNTLSFVGVVIVVYFTPGAPPPPRAGRSALRDLSDAARYIFTNRGPLAVFLASVVASMFAAPLVRFLSQFVLSVYGEPRDAIEEVVSKLLAIQGIGAVLGGIALRWLPGWYPKHHFIPMALSGLGLLITAFALCPYAPAGYAIMFFIGVFWIWSFNQTWAAMQNLAPDAMRGRVMAIANTASFGATAIGIGLGGFVGEVLLHRWLPLVNLVDDALSTQLALASLSVPLLVAGVVMLIKRTPEVDGMPRRPSVSRSLAHAIVAREHWPK